jgi:hypothetical protein
VYVRFHVRYEDEVADIRQEVHNWSDRYGVRYSSKLIKNHLRFGFDHNEHFTLFSMTWNPANLELRPWLKFEIINIANERY